MINMSENKDFIIENGMIKGYVGLKSGEIIIPDDVKGIEGFPPFLDIMEGEFSLTLSKNMTCSIGDLLSQEIVTLIIPESAELKFRPGEVNSNTGTAFFKKLEAINVDLNHATMSSENGLLYNKEKTILLCCPRAVKGKVVVAETVTEIMENAFYGCGDVTEVVLPAGITEIKERTFADCKSLKKIVIPSGVKTIQKDAFLRCSKLTTAGLKGTGGKKGFAYEFPWTKEIPANAFCGMKSLKKVVLPETIKVIGKNAFKSCAGLVEINLPDDVKIDAKAFKDCKKLMI